MVKIFEDVNLDKITFSDDGKSISFRLIDMYKGQFLKEIKCDSVLVFNYQNVFDDDEGFACHIIEINSKTIDKQDIKNYLKVFQFDFDNYLQDSGFNKLKILNLSGGEADIFVICLNIS